jgi:hypothetical protein
MLLASKAWWLREAARRSLDVNDFTGAAELAAQAEALQSTSGGHALLLLSSWLESADREIG